ncbi:SigE family RNA polymerase sigma factor [Crossiella sp. CA-258035]|uniref:SigE family RNA polymerase sigma factor n=1 Tax=Crossiella sp. CA-258035 TaxID=2981138 RepID=UPI0024BBEEC1|nr:SigE family RNA polymerase sigma factor [Crossiella sp. CA-258035]WHT23561.1 SigE family RNA polymerase sigma factor [Crossiella sp. CA-258035]
MPGWERDYAEYFTARAPALRRLAYAMCGDWHLAEDLVQATFIRLYRSWRRIRRETVDAYARRVLVNVFLSSTRGKGREHSVADPPERPAAPVRDSDTRLDLAAALAGLPPQQRAMVVLRYLEDLPIAEVARLLKVAQGTVKSQAARGVAALRARLGEAALAEMTEE